MDKMYMLILASTDL